MLAFFCFAAQSAQAERLIFKATLINDNDFEISPGGYIEHGPGFMLYNQGSLASPAVKSLCDTGITADFLFYLRKEHGEQIRAFSFDGGVKAHKSVEAVFEGFTERPLLSLLHKVSFSDDTCVGALSIALFDKSGAPTSSATQLHALDAGVFDNLKIKPGSDSILAHLNPKFWMKRATEPVLPISSSAILTSSGVELKIEPYQR